MEFTDDYSHDIPGVLYFSRSLPTKEAIDSYEYSMVNGCSCNRECTRENKCLCIRRSGTFYKYSNINDFKNYTIHDSANGTPTYECNDNCSCKEIVCGNRLIQFGPRKNLKVKSCENEKGLGLFATEEIKEGNFVCEYAGEIVTESQAFERFRHIKNNMNYIFCIKEYFPNKVMQTFIDPTYYGNIGRYINHSCEPNCNLVIIRINDIIPILGIFANQDIKENSEITYDYGDGESDVDVELMFDKFGKHLQKNCLCGSEKCRKYLPFDLSLAAI